MTEDDPLAWLIDWQAKRRQQEESASGIPFCPHRPTAQQRVFLDLQCPEALYGGAAGGGKSDAMLMAALQYVDRPGYAAIIFRRTYSDLALPEAIMDRSHRWLQGTEAHWVGDEKTWKFPSGATLSFGYMDNENDKFRYQGMAASFCGFDELTQFPESWYLYMFSRMRRLSDSNVPLRMRGATNPGGRGHKWVKARFGINSDGTVVNDGRKDKLFVPSKLCDNPHIDQETYRENLAKLDPITRAQLEEGRWIQDSSGLVYASWHRGLVVPKPVIDGPQRWHRILSFDFGHVDDTAWCVVAWPQHSRATYVLESHSIPGLIPSDCAGIALEADGRYRFDRIVGDLGGLGKGYAEEMRVRFSVPIEAAEKTNKLGYIKLLNGAFSNNEAFVCAGNEELCAQLEELPWADEAHSKEAPGFANHLCLASGTLVELDRGPTPIEQVTVGDWAWTRHGLRRVTQSAMTGVRELWRVDTTEGVLFATADHPVLANGAMAAVDTLLYGVRLFSWREWKLSNLTGAPTEDTRSRRTGHCAFTSGPTEGSDSTSKCGRRRTGQSQTGSSSTTLTAIRATTTCPIWNASQEQSTHRSIRALQNIEPCHDGTSCLPLLQRQSGTAPKLAVNGTQPTPKGLGPTPSQPSAHASCAALSSCPRSVQRKCARTSATRSGAETVGSTTCSGCACAAESNSAATDMTSRNVAPSLVLRASRTGIVAPVYNLTVDGAHEYFAEGILVSNCDSLLYGWRAACAFMERPDDSQPEHAPGTREAALAEGARLKQQAILQAAKRANAEAKARWGRMVGR